LQKQTEGEKKAAPGSGGFWTEKEEKEPRSPSRLGIKAARPQGRFVEKELGDSRMGRKGRKKNPKKMRRTGGEVNFCR